jgi:hypothetical protein
MAPHPEELARQAIAGIKIHASVHARRLAGARTFRAAIAVAEALAKVRPATRWDIKLPKGWKLATVRIIPIAAFCGKSRKSIAAARWSLPVARGGL